MIKQAASLPQVLGIAGALGATGGGIAGYYGSDKTNNAPATVLGALGGGAGTVAGLAGGFPLAFKLNDKLFDAEMNASALNKLNERIKEVQADPKKLSALNSMENLLKHKTALEKKIADTPKWLKYLAKRPKAQMAASIGTLGLGAGLGGTLGAALGVKGGDALA